MCNVDGDSVNKTVSLLDIAELHFVQCQESLYMFYIPVYDLTFASDMIEVSHTSALQWVGA